jgi:hypothetical protein
VSERASFILIRIFSPSAPSHAFTCRRQPQNHNSRPPVATHVIGASSVLMKDLRFGE